jgi:ligand-binding sensor domain-containing protein/signal transduction histidine kinase
MTTLVCWVLLMCGNNTIASDRWASLVDPAFHHITPEQGLPNGFSTALAQDKIGFLWIATPNGLARWDGYRIRIYKPQINDPRSLPDINIQSLHVDTHGRLWVGSSAGGLARYEPEHDHFTRFPVGPDGLSNITINTITSDDEDGIWVGTDDGLNHINHTTSKISQFNHGNSKSNILKNRRIRAILRARDGGLWLGTQTGLLYRPSGGVQFKEVSFPKQNSIAITQLYQATDGRIWVGTAAHGAYWYDARHKNLQPLATDASNQGNDWILSIIEPRPGETWFGTFGHGILIHQSQTNQLRRMRHDPSRRTGLSDDTIFAMLQDQSGLLWISSTRTVSRHDVSNHAVLSVFGLQSNNKLSDPNVRSVLSLPEGNIWLGLHSNGADIIHPDHGLIRSLRPDPLRPESALQKNRIWALLATGPDTIFLGTDRGLYRAKADGSALQRVQVAGRAADATVRALLRHGNKLFLGTNDGLWQYVLSGNQPVAPFRPEGAEQISDPRITSMLQGPDGSIWIGTRNGLNQYDPISHQVRKFMPNADNPKDLAPGLIASLLFDRRSHLWVATLGGGINVLEREGKQAQFRRISTSQGLPNDSVNCLMADGIGNIWASTDNGIARIEPEQLTIRTIQPADGAVHNNYWSSACDITSQGELVFGANGGLTIIRPNLLRKWTYRPPLVITDIKVGGQALPASRFNQAGETNKSVQIPSNANSLQVEFSALDFSAPDQNRYAYRLEGFDTDWIESDHTRRLAAWTNLAPGNYRLRLRGSNRDGEWAEQEVSVAVEVLAAWYQTWWWRSLILLVGLILIMTLVHLRTRYLYRKRVHLENEVRQRTLELEKNQHNLVRANQDLNRANGELAQSAETLRELGRIGRDITANLDLHVTFDTLYQHVVHLINAQCVIIYRHNRETGQLELAFGREHGKVMEMHVIGLDSPHSNTARTARERQEIMLDAKNALPESGLLRRKLRSALYVPLVVDHRLLGVMVVQSGLEYAYNERERLIFRNLCAYGAIALDNANAYRQLQETQARLVEQEKLAALGSMVAGVAHELNTPIGNSLLMLTALEDKKQLFEDKVARGQLRRSDLLDFLNDSNEASSVIMRGLTNAAELVASFKQVAVDRTAAHQRIFNLAHTTHEIIATLMNQVRLGGHHIEIDMADEISLNSYPGPYGQVITNLINNALLHAFDEGQQGIMRLSARQEVPERILIEFRDNGKGIDPKHIKRIFEPFFTTKMGQGGSGLGLSISYNIVSSLLNGTIRVESMPGQGTCFTLDLPLLAPAR